VGYRRAWIEKAGNGVKLEWCQDSAWRFFPIEPDAVLGWRLHRFDAITNKALALAGRSETRDLVDLVANHAQFPLHAVVWAACAKDAGYGPRLLLNQMQRNARIDPAELKEMGAAFDPVALKSQWLDLARQCDREIERAATADIDAGLAYVGPGGEIGWFDTSAYRPHRATLGGALPRIVSAGDA